MAGGDLLQVTVVVAVADAAAAGGDQRAAADWRPEPADDATAAPAAHQLRLMVIGRGRCRRVGHHRHAACADAGHRGLEVTSTSKHHLVTG